MYDCVPSPYFHQMSKRDIKKPLNCYPKYMMVVSMVGCRMAISSSILCESDSLSHAMVGTMACI